MIKLKYSAIKVLRLEYTLLVRSSRIYRNTFRHPLSAATVVPSVEAEGLVECDEGPISTVVHLSLTGEEVFLVHLVN